MQRFTLSCLAILLVPMAVHADDGGPPPPPSFSDIDTNNDLYIEASELRDFMERMREEAGRQGREGQRPPVPYGGPRGRPIELADADGDGMLNEQEFYDFVIRMEEMRERFRERMQDRNENE